MVESSRSVQRKEFCFHHLNTVLRDDPPFDRLKECGYHSNIEQVAAQLAQIPAVTKSQTPPTFGENLL